MTGPPRNQAILAVEGLSLRFYTDYGIAEALDELSLTVRHGEIMGLVGESGCGKTVTGRCILGVIPSPPGRIHNGRILFKGEDIVHMPQAELSARVRGKAISLIPQDPYLALNPIFPIKSQMTEIIRWNTGLDGTPEKFSVWRWLLGPAIQWGHRRIYRDRIVELLRQVQIPSPERLLSKYPHEFSGGQRQRILIASALSTNPEMIIADEPTTALDVTIQAQILKLLRELVKERGISVLFITHDFGVVARICDRVTVMYAGQEVEVSDTADILEKPSHPYTKKLIEALPERQGEDLKGIPGRVPSLIDPPSGCRFHPRCDQVIPVCRKQRPDPVTIGEDHHVRCHRFQDR